MRIKQEYKEVLVKSLKAHPKNPNRGDVQFIQESIQRNGWYGACTVQKSTGYILAGEHRWRAAKKEGALRIPVIVVDVDDRTALQIMLVDNESAKKGHLDQEVLTEILDSLVEMGNEDLSGTGFTLEDLEDIHDEQEEQDEGGEEDDGLFDPGDDEDAQTQWGVVVVVASESEQEQMFNEMKQRGLQVRCVAV